MTRPNKSRPAGPVARKAETGKANAREPNARMPNAPKPKALRPKTPAEALRESINYVAPGPDGDDPVPDDIDVFRLALSRRISGVLGMPRRCREPVCRRSKLCKGPDMRCARDFPPRPLSPEEDARLQAKVYRLVKQRVAELEAAGAGR